MLTATHHACGVCCVDIKNGKIEVLKKLINKGFQTLSFYLGCFARGTNVGKPLFLLFAGTYNGPEDDRVELTVQQNA